MTLLSTATNAALPRIWRVIESAPQTEIVTAQALAVSAPDAPMTTSDLAMQYQRLTGSLLGPSIDKIATILYVDGTPTYGELDVILQGESIDAAHVLQTRNDVTNFLHLYLYRLVVLQDNPLAYYRLGDGVGSITAADSSGRATATAATVTGGVTFGTAGAIVNDTNTAATLNGTSGYITLPSAIKPDGALAFSFELWMQYTGSLSSFPRLLANDDAQANLRGFDIGLATGGNIYCNVGIGGAWKQAYAATTLAASTWYHVVATYDGAALRLYVNGASVASTAATGAYTPSPNAIRIGNIPPSGPVYFAGSVDECAPVYTSALSPARILAHYQAGIGIG